MIQFSESYNAKTIFDQVWESHYSWFTRVRHIDDNLPENILGHVAETDDDGRFIQVCAVTVDMIEEAVIKFYMEFVANRVGSWAKPMSDYLEDMDADDVDAILQLACFKEIRYG